MFNQFQQVQHLETTFPTLVKQQASSNFWPIFSCSVEQSFFISWNIFLFPSVSPWRPPLRSYLWCIRPHEVSYWWCLFHKNITHLLHNFFKKVLINQQKILTQEKCFYCSEWLAGKKKKQNHGQRFLRTILLASEAADQLCEPTPFWGSLTGMIN